MFALVHNAEDQRLVSLHNASPQTRSAYYMQVLGPVSRKEVQAQKADVMLHVDGTHRLATNWPEHDASIER